MCVSVLQSDDGCLSMFRYEFRMGYFSSELDEGTMGCFGDFMYVGWCTVYVFCC